MSTERDTPKSLWEHAGYPGVPNARQSQTQEDVDRTFKEHLQAQHDEQAATHERVESVLAWSVLREDDLRSKLAFLYDYEMLNQATNREPGPAELLDYQLQVDEVEQQVDERVRQRRAEGMSERDAENLRGNMFNRLHDENTRLSRPALPGVSETWEPRHPLLKAVAVGVSWTAFAGALVFVLHMLGWAGPIGELLMRWTWLGALAGVAGGALVGLWSLNVFMARPRSEGRWLLEDTRGNWPALFWGAAMIAVGVAAPLWVTAVAVPVSAAALLANPRLRQRILGSLGGATEPALQAKELLGATADYGANVFVPAASTQQAAGPALPTFLPAHLRYGSSADTVNATQEGLLELADHCSVYPSGMETDVHKIVAALLLDVVVASTGADDLRLIAQYGNGSMHVTARALSIGLGQEVLEVEPVDAAALPGRAVADWFEEEAVAYRQFVDAHLQPADATLALRCALGVLVNSEELDFPHRVRYRLETLVYALRSAASSSSSAS